MDDTNNMPKGDDTVTTGQVGDDQDGVEKDENGDPVVKPAYGQQDGEVAKEDGEDDGDEEKGTDEEPAA